MNVKEKGKSGIYTKVYGYIPKVPEVKKVGKTDYWQFDLVYDTGSVDLKTNKPITGGIRCQVSAEKCAQNNITLKVGSRLEVGGPLKVDYVKKGQWVVEGQEDKGLQELGKTYVSLRVAEISED